MASRKTDESAGKGRSRTALTSREHEPMTLNARDREMFVAALLNAPAPGARLRQAARRYKKQVGK
jgi:uncharacterized protein (DUF1778 family)